MTGNILRNFLIFQVFQTTYGFFDFQADPYFGNFESRWISPRPYRTTSLIGPNEYLNINFQPSIYTTFLPFGIRIPYVLTPVELLESYGKLALDVDFGLFEPNYRYGLGSHSLYYLLYEPIDDYGLLETINSYGQLWLDPNHADYGHYGTTSIRSNILINGYDKYRLNGGNSLIKPVTTYLPEMVNYDNGLFHTPIEDYSLLKTLSEYDLKNLNTDHFSYSLLNLYRIIEMSVCHKLYDVEGVYDPRLLICLFTVNEKYEPYILPEHYIRTWLPISHHLFSDSTFRSQNLLADYKFGPWKGQHYGLFDLAEINGPISLHNIYDKYGIEGKYVPHLFHALYRELGSDQNPLLKTYKTYEIPDVHGPYRKLDSHELYGHNTGYGIHLSLEGFRPSYLTRFYDPQLLHKDHGLPEIHYDYMKQRLLQSYIQNYPTDNFDLGLLFGVYGPYESQDSYGPYNDLESSNFYWNKYSYGLESLFDGYNPHYDISLYNKQWRVDHGLHWWDWDSDNLRTLGYYGSDTRLEDYFSLVPSSDYDMYRIFNNLPLHELDNYDSQNLLDILYRSNTNELYWTEGIESKYPDYGLYEFHSKSGLNAIPVGYGPYTFFGDFVIHRPNVYNAEYDGDIYYYNWPQGIHELLRLQHGSPHAYEAENSWSHSFLPKFPIPQNWPYEVRPPGILHDWQYEIPSKPEISYGWPHEQLQLYRSWPYWPTISHPEVIQHGREYVIKGLPAIRPLPKIHRGWQYQIHSQPRFKQDLSYPVHPLTQIRHDLPLSIHKIPDWSNVHPLPKIRYGWPYSRLLQPEPHTLPSEISEPQVISSTYPVSEQRDLHLSAPVEPYIESVPQQDFVSHHAIRYQLLGQEELGHHTEHGTNKILEEGVVAGKKAVVADKKTAVEIKERKTIQNAIETSLLGLGEPILESEILKSQNIANIQPVIEEVSPIHFGAALPAQEVTLPIQPLVVNNDEKSRLNFNSEKPIEEIINYAGITELPTEESNSHNERLKLITDDINPSIRPQEQSLYHLTPLSSEIKPYNENEGIAAHVVKSDILIEGKLDTKIYGKEYVTGVNLKPYSVFKDKITDVEHFTPIISEPRHYGKSMKESSFDSSPAPVNTKLNTLNDGGGDAISQHVAPFNLNEGKYVDHEYVTVTEQSLYRKQDDIPVKYTEPFTITDVKTPVISGGKILSDDIKPYTGVEEKMEKVYEHPKPMSAYDYIENTQPSETTQSHSTVYYETPKFLKSESRAYVEGSQQITTSQDEPTVQYEFNRPSNIEETPVMWNYANPNFLSNYPFTLTTNQGEVYDYFNNEPKFIQEYKIPSPSFMPITEPPSIGMNIIKPIMNNKVISIPIPITKDQGPISKLFTGQKEKAIGGKNEKILIKEGAYTGVKSIEKLVKSIAPYQKNIMLSKEKSVAKNIEKVIIQKPKSSPIPIAITKPVIRQNKLKVIEDKKAFKKDKFIVKDTIKSLPLLPKPEISKQILAPVKPIILPKAQTMIKEIIPPIAPHKNKLLIEETKSDAINEFSMLQELQTYTNERMKFDEKVRPLDILHEKSIIETNKPLIVPMKKTVAPIIELPVVTIGEKIRPIEVTHKKPITLEQTKPIIMKPPIFKVPFSETVKPVMKTENKMDMFLEMDTYNNEQRVIGEKIKPLEIKPVEVIFKKPIVLEGNKPIITPIKKPLIPLVKFPFAETVKPVMTNENKMDMFLEMNTYNNEQNVIEEKIKPLKIKPVAIVHKKPIILEEIKPIIIPIKKPLIPVFKIPIAKTVKPIITNKNKMDVFEEMKTYSDEQSVLEDNFKPLNIKPVELIYKKPIILEENKPIISPIKKPVTPFIKFPVAETVKPLMMDRNKMDIFLEMKTYGNEQAVVKEKIKPLKIEPADVVYEKPIVLEDNKPNIRPFKKPLIQVFEVPIAETVKPIMKKENQMNVFEEIKTYSNEESVVKEKIKPLKAKPVEVIYKKPITLEKIKSITMPIKKPPIPVFRVPVAKTVKSTLSNENKMDVFEELKTYSNEQSVFEDKVKPLKIVEKKPTMFEEMKPQFFPNVKKSFSMFDRMSFYPEEKPMMFDENKYDFYKEFRNPDNEQEYFEEKYEPFEMMNKEPTFMDERTPITLQNRKPVNIPEVIPATKEVKPQNFAFVQEMKPAVLLTKKPVTLPNKIENIEGLKKFVDQELLGVKLKSFENTNKKSILTEVRPSIIPKNRLEISPNIVQVAKITNPLKPIIYQQLKPVHISNKSPVPKPITTFEEKPNKLDVFEKVKTYSNKQVFVKEDIKPLKLLDEKKLYESGIKPVIVPDIKQTILSQRRPIPELKPSESKIGLKMRPIILPVKEPVPHLIHQPLKQEIISKIKPIITPVLSPIIFPPKIKYFKDNKPLNSAIIKEIKPLTTLVTKPVKVSVVEEAKQLFSEGHNAGMFEELKTDSNSHSTVEQKGNLMTEFEERLLKEQHLRQMPNKDNIFFGNFKQLDLPQIPILKIPPSTRTDKKIFFKTVGKNKGDMFHKFEAYSDEKFITDKMKPLNIDETREEVKFAKPIFTQVRKGVLFPLIKKPQVLVVDTKPMFVSRVERRPIGVGTESVTQDFKSYRKEKSVFKENIKPPTFVEQMPIAKKTSTLPLPYIATMQRIKPSTLSKLNPLRETKIINAEKPTGPSKIIAAVLKETKIPKTMNININKTYIPVIEPIFTSEQKPIFTKVPQVLSLENKKSEKIYSDVPKILVEPRPLIKRGEKLFLTKKLTPLISSRGKTTVVKELKSIENKNIITEENIIKPMNTLNIASKLNPLKPPKFEHFKGFNKNKDNMMEEIGPLDVFYSKLRLIHESGPSPESGEKHMIFEGISQEKEHQKLPVVHEAKSLFTDQRKQNIIKEFKPVTKKIIALDAENVITKEHMKPPTPFKSEWQIFHKLKQVTDHKIKPFNNLALKRLEFKEHPVYDHYGSAIFEDVKHGSADRKISIVSNGPKPIFVGGKVTSLIKKPLPIFFGENRGAVLDDLRPLGSRTVEVDNKIEHFDTFEGKPQLLNKPANIYDIISQLQNTTSNVYDSRSDIFHDIGHFEIRNNGDAINYEVKTTTKDKNSKPLLNIPKQKPERKAVVFQNINYPKINERKLEALQQLKNIHKENSIFEEQIKPLTVIEKIEAHPDKTELLTSSKSIMLPVMKHAVVETKHPIVEIKHVIIDKKPLIIGNRQTNPVTNLKSVGKKVEPLLLGEEKDINLQDMKAMNMYSYQKDTFLGKTRPIPLISTEPLVSKIITPKEEHNVVQNIKPLLKDSVTEDTVPIVNLVKNPITTGVHKNIITGSNEVRVSEELNTYTNKEIITKDKITHFSDNQKKHVAIPETKLIIKPIRKDIVLEEPISASIPIIKPLPKLQNPIIKHMVLEHHAPVVMEHKIPIIVKDLKPLTEFHKRLTVPIKKGIANEKLEPVIVESRVPVIFSDIKSETELHKPAIPPLKSRVVFERPRPVILEPNLPVLVKKTKAPPAPLIVPVKKVTVFDKPRPVTVETKVPIITQNNIPIPKPLIVPIIKEAVFEKPRPVIVEPKVPIIVQNNMPIPEPVILPVIKEAVFEKTTPLILKPKLPITVQTITPIPEPVIFPAIRDAAFEKPRSVTVESKLPIISLNIKPISKSIIGPMRKENIYGKPRPVLAESKIPIIIQNLRPTPQSVIVPIKRDILLQKSKHVMIEPKLPVIVPHTKSVTAIHELKDFDELNSYLAEDKAREISEFETRNKEKASISKNMKLLGVLEMKPILEEKISIVAPTKKHSIIEEVKHIFIDHKIPPVVIASKPALLTNRNIIVKPKVASNSEVNAIEESQTYSDQKLMLKEKIKSLHSPETKRILTERPKEKLVKLYHQIQSKIPIVGHLQPKTFQTNTYKLPDLASGVTLEKHSAGHEQKDLDVLTKFRYPEDKTSFLHTHEHINPKNIKESRLSFAEGSLHEKKSLAYEDSQAQQFEDKHAPHFDNGEHFQHDSKEYHDNGEKQFFAHESKSMGFERHDSDEYHDNEYNEKALHDNEYNEKAIHENRKHSEPHMDVHKSDYTDYEGRSYHSGDIKAASIGNSKFHDDGHKKTVVIETKPHSIEQLKDLVVGGLKSLNIEHKDILEIPKALVKMKQIYTESDKKDGDREQIKIHIKDSGDHGNTNKLRRAHQFQNFRIKEAEFDNIKDFVYSIKTHGFKDSKTFGVNNKNQGIATGHANSVSFSHYDKKELKPNLFQDMKYPIHIDEKVVGPKYSFGKKKSYTYDFTKNLGQGKEKTHGKKQRYKFGKVSEHGYETGKMKSFVEEHKYTSKKNVGHEDLKYYELGEKKGETVSDNIGYAAGKAFDIEKGIEKIFRIVL